MVTVKEPQCLEVIFLVLVLSLGRYSETEATVEVNKNELTTVGKTVTIVCTVTEERFVGWFDLQGDEVTTRWVPGLLLRDKYYVIDIGGDEYKLVIQNVAVEDGGSYTCKGEKETKISTLYVEFFVTGFRQNQDLFVGQTQIIQCSADGYPKPTFVWFKELEESNALKQIDFSDPRLTLLSNGSLLIKNVIELDSGTYACQILQLGDIGRTRQEIKEIKVTVYGPPRINREESSRDLHSYIGNPVPVLIKCKWWGFPVPEVRITKDGKELPDEDVKKSDGSVEATVNADKDADFGTYLCNATNSQGSANHSVMVRKAVPPSSPRNIAFTTNCDLLTVAWAEPASDGGVPIKRYTVTLSDGNQTIDTVYVTVGTTRFTFTNQDGVQPRTFYSISVQAANELNEGDMGEGNITSAYCPPSGVFHITNNATSLNTSSFILTWTRPPRDGGDANITYDVQYSKSNPQGKFVHWTSRKAISELALNVSGLTGESVYEFRVFASNIAGRKREPAIKRFDVHLPSVVVVPKPGETCQPDLVYDMHVNCSSLYMQVDFALRSSYLDFETFRFVNESCGSRIATSSHILMKTPLKSCGTTSKHRGDTVTYYNTVVARTKDASKVYIVEFPFSCTYGKMRVVGVPSFQPRKKITFIEEGRGNFSFEMDLFRNAEYKSSYEISEYPVSISPTSKLYCQAKLDTSDSELVLMADLCVATPSVDPFHRIKYTFIENGCPVDNETEYNYIVSDTQRFQLSPFRWTRNYTIVYLHCKVLVCHKDKNTRCYKGCLPSHLRNVRSATREEYLQVTLGPIIMHEPHQPNSHVVHEGPVHHSSKTVDSSAPLWPVILIICGTVIGLGLVLYGIVYLVYYRSSKLHHRGHLTIQRPSEELELFTSETV